MWEAPSLEVLRESVAKLEKEVEKLQKQVDKQKRETAENIAKIQAKFFLEKFFVPFFDGLCEARNYTLDQVVTNLIDEDTTLDSLFEENLDRTSNLMASAEFRVVFSAIRPIIDNPDEWIKEHSLVLLEVMHEVRPSTAEIISTKDGGRKWFADSLIGLKHMLMSQP